MKSNKEKKFFRNCPICDKQAGYTYASSRDRAESNGSVCRSCATRKVMKGVSKSVKHKNNISASNKGRIITAEHRAKIGAAHKGIPHTAESRANMSAAKQKKRDACTEMYGEKIEYTRHHLAKWSIAVKKRDNYTCKRCNTVATGYYINAHHIMPKEYFPEMAHDISNGITLCKSCHQKIHGDLDRISLEGIKLSPVGFQEHAARFIADGKASSQSGQTPPGYTSVFSASVTIVKE